MAGLSPRFVSATVNVTSCPMLAVGGAVIVIDAGCCSTSEGSGGWYSKAVTVSDDGLLGASQRGVPLIPGPDGEDPGTASTVPLPSGRVTTTVVGTRSWPHQFVQKSHQLP